MCEISKAALLQRMRGVVGVAAALLMVTLSIESAVAQPADPAAAETVSWTAAVSQTAATKPAEALTVTLHAKVQEGWHVYALNQLPDGPTPLRIVIDPNQVATASGAPLGSPATKVHDPSFNLDTPLYSRAFSATVPVRVAAHAAAGRQSIPVSVRFQTCNGRICQPPKTVHLSVPITVAAAG
jgi:DsbC/DsbD-like thiol-disulfide interchange protein